MDLWFEQEVKPRLRGRAALVRYADDATLIFEREEDAQRVLGVLPKRLGRFGLKLHPEKTRLVDFRRPRGGRRNGAGHTFEMLGFTHLGEKPSRALRQTQDGEGSPRSAIEASRPMVPPTDTGGWLTSTLNRKLRGHYAYYDLAVARAGGGNRGDLGDVSIRDRRIMLS